MNVHRHHLGSLRRTGFGRLLKDLSLCQETRRRCHCLCSIRYEWSELVPEWHSHQLSTSALSGCTEMVESTCAVLLWRARFAAQGMPKGRFACLPAFGILLLQPPRRPPLDIYTHFAGANCGGQATSTCTWADEIVPRIMLTSRAWHSCHITSSAAPLLRRTVSCTGTS